MNLHRTQGRTASYAQTLRAIGQTLEVLDLEAFELKSDGRDYLVRGETAALLLEKQDLQESGLRAVWRRLLRGQQAKPRSIELRYTPEDIDRLQREGQTRRRDPHEIPDPYSVSEILRAVGAYLDLKGAHLLEVSRRNGRVTIQYETAEGRRTVEKHKLSSLYNFWVHRCMQRDSHSKRAYTVLERDP